MTKRVLVALGGNALGKTPEEQLEKVQNTASSLVDMAEGNELIITHGNGPQVGMINNAFTFSADKGGETPEMPFPECGAMSQGYIGYQLTQALDNEIKKRGLDRKVVDIVSSTLVDKDDPAFGRPTKPIGNFMTKEEAEKKAKEQGFEFVEDSGRGYRRVIASPTPKEVLELDSITKLVADNFIVICAGGGGVPVYKDEEGNLTGIPAVLDKDRTAARLAIDAKCDLLLILTAVEHIAINFNKPNQEELSEITVSQAKKYIESGEFGEGSMQPKVEACITFLEEHPEGVALVTSLDKAEQALKGETGTRIVAD